MGRHRAEDFVTGERVERRLAAIVAADVAGYSRLMGLDEVGTARTLREHRKVTDALVAKHGGRLVKSTGDGVLLEFPSVVDAVECAVAVQAVMAQRNEAIPQDRRMLFRVGVNLGDILIDGEDILGDGVNIAARLEVIAEPGGICLSSSACEHVLGKVAVEFIDLGEQKLKNIERPVRVYAVKSPGHLQAIAHGTAASLRERQQQLPLPDRPSIAVLPFQNMSGDPEQEYFADGMAEDIITALSQFKSLFVIARNSSFTYKGKAVDIKQIGRELGVRYVLEGSVRKSGSRVRITGQLVEAATGTHLWAERIDGALEDVFELQDEVTARVAGAIEPSITQAEIDRARVKPTSNLDAYDCYLRALSNFYQLTRERNDVAADYLRQAIALDPAYALAKARLAVNQMLRMIQGWGEAGDMEKGMALARDAIADDPNDPSVLRAAGHVLGFWGEYDRALTVLEKAARLNVNSSQVLSSLGWVMVYACIEPDRAILHFERAMRLSPRDPETNIMLNGIALAHLVAGRPAQALLAAQKGIDDTPRFASVHRMKIAALVDLGRLQEARTAATTFLTLDPTFTITTRLPKLRDAAFQKRYYGALKAAGLPE
jgi:adenylate cyclase